MNYQNFSGELGKRLKEIRASKGLSQEELADLADVHRTYIGLVERGQRNLTVKILIKILSILQIELKEFFDDEAFKIASIKLKK